MVTLDFDALDAAPLQRDPYEYLIVPNFVPPAEFKRVIADYPAIPGPGSHPPSELDIRGAFGEFIRTLEGERFRSAIERKFDIDLSGRPTMYTVRGFIRGNEGSIHTDSASKIITVLFYMNEDWAEDGGRLRILRKPDDLEDFAAEVPPSNGTLLVFRRSEKSWHGHKPFEGRRRVVQLNWVTSAEVVAREQRRHRLATRLKKLKLWMSGRAAA
jgi:hypothetical protein